MKKIFLISSLFIASVCKAQNLTYFRSIASSSTATQVNAGFTQIKAININNLTTAIVYVKLYNKATAPTVSDTPVITLQIASNALSHQSYQDMKT